MEIWIHSSHDRNHCLVGRLLTHNAGWRRIGNYSGRLSGTLCQQSFSKGGLEDLWAWNSHVVDANSQHERSDPGRPTSVSSGEFTSFNLFPAQSDILLCLVGDRIFEVRFKRFQFRRDSFKTFPRADFLDSRLDSHGLQPR